MEILLEWKKVRKFFRTYFFLHKNFLGTSDRSGCSIYICGDSGIQRYCDPKAETCHNDCRKDQEPFFNNDECKWDCKVNFERYMKTNVISEKSSKLRLYDLYRDQPPALEISPPTGSELNIFEKLYYVIFIYC